MVTKIWQELKHRGLIGDNNRLTHAWYSYSGSLLLDCVNDIADKLVLKQDKQETSFIHTYIAQALNNASNNHDYRKILPGNFEIFRPARTLRGWKSTGKLSFSSSAAYPVQPWDVGSNLSLKKHEASGDELEHDHIPSQCWMKEDITQQYSTYRYIDAEQCNEEKKRDDDWGCIAVPDEMHKSGKTHFKGVNKQNSIKKPFYVELEYYINKTLTEASSPIDIIEVIGAFRYLFSCHIKEKFTTYSYGFFSTRPDLVDDIDTLLLDKLSEVSARL